MQDSGSKIRLVAGKQSINSELESYQVRTVDIFERRGDGRQLRPFPHIGGVEFIYGSAVLGGYAEELHRGGMAVGVQVVGLLVSGKPKRRRVTVCEDWHFQSR